MSHREISGRQLRYAVALRLFDERRAMTVAELVDHLANDGLAIAGRPGKTVSDALRWEVGRGRVVRLGRGLYGPGRIPESTRRYLRWWLGASLRSPDGWVRSSM